MNCYNGQFSFDIPSDLGGNNNIVDGSVGGNLKGYNNKIEKSVTDNVE